MGGLAFTTKLRWACGYFFRQVFNLLNGWPVLCMMRKIWSALMMPSPVVVKSRKMM